MRVWAIVPMKPFPKAKSRLSGVLTTEQREVLAERFFRHTLDVLSQVKEVSNILVISRDPQVLSLAREYHAVTVQEAGAPELNAALMRAAQVAGLKGAEAILILPADLPLLTTDDVREILRLGRYNQTVVLAPDRQDDGTNAMLVAPPGLIPFAYGSQSFQRHQESAVQAGVTVKIYRSETIGLDIDTPQDLMLLERAETGTTTTTTAEVEAVSGK